MPCGSPERSADHGFAPSLTNPSMRGSEPSTNCKQTVSDIDWAFIESQCAECGGMGGRGDSVVEMGE